MSRAPENKVASIRARSARDLIDYLRMSRPGAEAQMRSRISAGTWDAVMNGALTDWIPITMDAEVVNALVDIYGAQEAGTVWREFMGPMSKSTMLRGIMNMAFRLLGASPASLVKLAPKGLALAYRNCFDVRVTQVEKHSAALSLEAVSPDILAHEAYMICLRAIFESFFDLAKCPGELSYELDRQARRIDVRWAWS